MQQRRARGRQGQGRAGTFCVPSPQMRAPTAPPAASPPATASSKGSSTALAPVASSRPNAHARARCEKAAFVAHSLPQCTPAHAPDALKLRASACTPADFPALLCQTLPFTPLPARLLHAPEYAHLHSLHPHKARRREAAGRPCAAAGRGATGAAAARAAAAGAAAALVGQPAASMRRSLSAHCACTVGLPASPTLPTAVLNPGTSLARYALAVEEGRAEGQEVRRHWGRRRCLGRAALPPRPLRHAWPQSSNGLSPAQQLLFLQGTLAGYSTLLAWPL